MHITHPTLTVVSVCSLEAIKSPIAIIVHIAFHCKSIASVEHTPGKPFASDNMQLQMAATTRPVCATRVSTQASRARSARSMRVVAMAHKEQEAKVGGLQIAHVQTSCVPDLWRFFTAIRSMQHHARCTGSQGGSSSCIGLCIGSCSPSSAGSTGDGLDRRGVWLFAIVQVLYLVDDAR